MDVETIWSSSEFSSSVPSPPIASGRLSGTAFWTPTDGSTGFIPCVERASNLNCRPKAVWLAGVSNDVRALRALSVTA